MDVVVVVRPREMDDAPATTFYYIDLVVFTLIADTVPYAITLLPRMPSSELKE